MAFEYPDDVQAQLSGTTLAPPNYRHVVEQFFGATGMVETSEDHWRHFDSGKRDVTEKAPREIAIDAVAAFVERIQQGKRRTPEHVRPKARSPRFSAGWPWTSGGKSHGKNDAIREVFANS